MELLFPYQLYLLDHLMHIYLKRSGNNGSENLNAFGEVDIVSAFVVEVSKKMLDISVIKISDMLCKCIRVFCKNSSHDYVVQPNNFEHH